MGVALGWMALAMAMVGAGPEAGRGAVPITYSVRFVEVEGLGWRDAALARMTPVTRQGGATVWTAPPEAVKHLFECAQRTVSGSVLAAPRVTAWSGVPAHVTTRSDRRMVTHASWSGDDRPVPAKPETVRAGTAATISGRKLDQGILVQMVLQDTQILAVHRVALGGGKAAPSDPAAKKAAYSPEACTAAAACCSSDSNSSCCAAAHAATVAVEVPEIGNQEIAGEWLIPKDGFLLVSFGPHTVAGKDGKAVIRERLAIVEAAEAAAPIGAAIPRQAPWGATAYQLPPFPAPAAIAAAPVTMAPAMAPSPIAIPAAPAAAMPPMPSRSIPQGYHADGKAAELPPLPPEEAEDDEDDDSSASAETRPSPQAKKARKSGAKKAAKPAPPADTAMRKVQFSIANFQAIPSLFQSAPTTVGLQFLLPIKPVSLKLPFNRRLELEIYGRIVPAPEPARSSANLATKPAGDGATTK